MSTWLLSWQICFVSYIYAYSDDSNVISFDTGEYLINSPSLKCSEQEKSFIPPRLTKYKPVIRTRMEKVMSFVDTDLQVEDNQFLQQTEIIDEQDYFYPRLVVGVVNYRTFVVLNEDNIQCDVLERDKNAWVGYMPLEAKISLRLFHKMSSMIAEKYSKRRLIAEKMVDYTAQYGDPAEVTLVNEEECPLIVYEEFYFSRYTLLGPISAEMDEEYDDIEYQDDNEEENSFHMYGIKHSTTHSKGIITNFKSQESKFKRKIGVNGTIRTLPHQELHIKQQKFGMKSKKKEKNKLVTNMHTPSSHRNMVYTLEKRHIVTNNTQIDTPSNRYTQQSVWKSPLLATGGECSEDCLKAVVGALWVERGRSTKKHVMQVLRTSKNAQDVANKLVSSVDLGRLGRRQKPRNTELFDLVHSIVKNTLQNNKKYTTFSVNNSPDLMKQSRTMKNKVARAAKMTDKLFIQSLFQDTSYAGQVDLSNQVSVHNSRARWLAITGKDPVPLTSKTYNNQLTRYHSLGLDGKGMVVGLSDTGVDASSCYFYDGDHEIPYGTTDTKHRKFKQYYRYIDGMDTMAGHGTHVAGTLTGCGGTQDETTESSNGMQPNARLAFFDLGDASGAQYLPDDAAVIWDSAATQGAVVHSNSWGCGLNTGDPAWYCNVYDDLAYSSDDFSFRQDQTLQVFAGGNDGSFGEFTLGTPATSKNALALGAQSQSFTAGKSAFQAAPNMDWYYNQQNVAPFSSVGPTSDQRIKPDLVAPGWTMVSTRASGLAPSKGSIHSCNTFPMAGTSMSAPVAAGVAGIVHQYLMQIYVPEVQEASNTGVASLQGDLPINQNNRKVTSQLLKALLIGGAQSLKYKAGESFADQRVPMQKQPFLNDTMNGFRHIRLGALYKLDTNETFNYYIRMTSQADCAEEDGCSSTNARSVILVLQPTCTSSFELIRTVGFDGTGSTTPQFNQTMKSTYSGSELRSLLITDLLEGTGVSLSLKLTLGNTCSFYFGVLEYDGKEPSLGSTSRAADCGTTVADFPIFTPNSMSTYPTLRIHCPPSLVCTDAYISQQHPSTMSKIQVLGNGMFHTSSPICRASLISGALNSTVVRAYTSYNNNAYTLRNRSIYEYYDKVACLQPRQVVEVTTSHLGTRRYTQEATCNTGVCSKSATIEQNTPIFQITSLGELSLRGGAVYARSSIFFSADTSTICDCGRAVCAYNSTGNTISNNLQQLLPLQPIDIYQGFGSMHLAATAPLVYRNGDKVMNTPVISTLNSNLAQGGGMDSFSILNSGSIDVGDGGWRTQCFMVKQRTTVNNDIIEPQNIDQLPRNVEDGRVVLVWNDRPGWVANTHVLVNDQDLFLFSMDGERRGNAAFYGSITGSGGGLGGVDRRNNVEMTTPQIGLNCATVKGVRVPVGIQKYALTVHSAGVDRCHDSKIRSAFQSAANDYEKEGSETDGIGGFYRQDTGCQDIPTLHVVQAGDCWYWKAITSDQVIGAQQKASSSSFVGLRRSTEDLGNQEDENQVGNTLFSIGTVAWGRLTGGDAVSTISLSMEGNTYRTTMDIPRGAIVSVGNTGVKLTIQTDACTSTLQRISRHADVQKSVQGRIYTPPPVTPTPQDTPSTSNDTDHPRSISWFVFLLCTLTIYHIVG